MCIGQKKGIVQQWGRHGARPRQSADQRYESAYLFGAFCPTRGVGAGTTMPFADASAMQAHFDEIGRTVARGDHTVLPLDRVLHTTGKLKLPRNLSLIVPPQARPSSTRSNPAVITSTDMRCRAK